MTQYDGLGVSDYTPHKQARLTAILKMHIKITACVMQRYGGVYHYFDLNAGPGHYRNNAGDNITGSPLVFIDTAECEHVQYHAVMVEQCQASFRSLAEHLTPYASKCEVHCGNHDVVMEHYLSRHPRALGLLYSDPTPSGNDGGIPFSLLSRFTAMYPKVEILLHVAANALKRTQRAGDSDLIAKLGILNKAHWLAMEPAGNWQWTFLLGSNCDLFTDYKRIGFYRIDNQKGRAIIERLNYTKDQLVARQQPALPNVCGVPEAPEVPANPHVCHAAESWALRTVRAKAANRNASREVSSLGNVRHAR